MNEIAMLPAENTSLLSDIHNGGIEVIKMIQSIENPVITAIIKGITFLGSGYFYIFLILFIFWCIDEKRGLSLGVLIIISAWANSFAKDIFKHPRPFNLEASLGLAHESSYGFPSGHAQISLTLWIPIAAWRAHAWANKQAEKTKNRRQIIWGGAIFFILLISFTRLYLGVHFPTDLFAGWLLGGVILIIWFLPGPRLEKLFASIERRYQNITVAAIALVMNGLYPGSYSALFLGFCLGYIFMRKNFPFHAQAKINGKKPGVKIMFFRCFTGFLGIGIIYLGLKLMLPGEGSLWNGLYSFYQLADFVRYSLFGFWASAGAPWIFNRMNLSSNELSSNELS